MPTALLVAIYSLLFSSVTVVSILLTGSRVFLSKGASSPWRAAWNLVWDWHFILGAGFAFMARVFFVLINQALYRDPRLSQSSTTVTTLVSVVGTIAVVGANVLILGERLTPRQISGAAVILAGVVLLTAR